VGLTEISITIISEESVLQNAQWKLSFGNPGSLCVNDGERRCIAYTTMLFLFYLFTSPFHDICPRFKL